MTCRAPRCSSTSVKPPVDAPMSSASRPGDVDAEGIQRVRELDPAAADPGMVGLDDAHLGLGGDHRARPCAHACPPTSTFPARISARAFSRDSTRPARDEQRVQAHPAGHVAPLDDPARDAARWESPQRAANGSASRRAARHTAARAGATVRGRRERHRWVCRRRRPCPLFFPSVGRRARHVQHVVHDLKREADLARHSDPCASSVSSFAPAMTAPAGTGARISAPVFRACMALQRRGVERCGGLPRAHAPNGGEIDGLATDHARGAGRLGDHDAVARSFRARRSASRRAGLARQQAKRLGLEPVAGEDGHPLAVHDVRASAALGAASHRPWPAGRRESASRCGSSPSRTRRASRARGPARGQVAATASAAASVSNGRSRLPRPRSAVAHGVVDDGRGIGRRRQHRRQRGFDHGASRVEVGGQRHGRSTPLRRGIEPERGRRGLERRRAR